MPTVIGMEGLVGTMKMGGPVTPTSTAVEQAAVESLLALASLTLLSGPRYLVPSLITTAEQAAAPAMLPVAEPLV